MGAYLPITDTILSERLSDFHLWNDFTTGTNDIFGSRWSSKITRFPKPATFKLERLEMDRWFYRSDRQTHEGRLSFDYHQQSSGSARKMTTEDLNDIHKNMMNDIQEQGGNIEKIYYCPHGWDEGCTCQAKYWYVLRCAKRFSLGSNKNNVHR